VLLEPPLDAAAAAKKQAELLRKHGVRTTLAEEVRRPAEVELALEDGDGTPLGTAAGPVRAETSDGAGFEVRTVEFGVGYPNHGFENRSYRGALSFAADVEGTLAVVNLVSLEDLLAGLVPSRSSPRRPTLKAQAVPPGARCWPRSGRATSRPHLSAPSSTACTRAARRALPPQR
jgi:hypothetical protein